MVSEPLVKDKDTDKPLSLLYDPSFAVAALSATPELLEYDTKYNRFII
jgi:hypothetical protein